MKSTQQWVVGVIVVALLVVSCAVASDDGQSEVLQQEAVVSPDGHTGNDDGSADLNVNTNTDDGDSVDASKVKNSVPPTSENDGDDSQQPRSHEDEIVEAVSRELQALDEVMTAATRKAEALRRLREALLAGGTLPAGQHVSDGVVSVVQANLDRMQRRGVQMNNIPPPQPRVLHSQYNGQHRRHAFRDYFLLKANISLPQDVTIDAVEMMSVRSRRPRGASRRSPLGSLFFALVAGSDGNFYFYDKSGTLLLSTPSGHEARITTLAHDFTDVPAVFSAAKDGTVRVATLNVWFDGKLVAGRLPPNALHGRAELPVHNTIHREVLKASQEDHGKEAEHVDPTFEPAGLGMSLHLSLYAKWQARDDVAAAVQRLDSGAQASVSDDVANTAFVTTLGAYHYSSRRMVVATTNVGVIAVHLFNGTSLKSFHYSTTHRALPRKVPRGDGPVPPPPPAPKFDEPITSITRYGARVAYAVGGNIRFMNLVKPTRTHGDLHMCEGTGSPIVSLAFDYVKPSTVWAGTQGGDLLMFDSQAKLQTSSNCRLLARISSDNGEPVSVTTTRGYVVSMTTAGIEVHNTTGSDSGDVQWVLSRELNNTGGETLAALRSATVGGRLSANVQTMVIVATIGGQSLELHESLLPYHPQHYDVSWLRGPLLAIAVAVVVGYQILKRRGGGGRAPSVEDIANHLKVPGADGSVYGAAGSSFAASRGRFGGGGGGGGVGMPSTGGRFNRAAVAGARRPGR